MLYLAEVRKYKSGGILAKTTTELRLLACQRTDQTWSAVPSDEVIEGDAAAEFEQGVLVVANLNNNRQVQGPPEPAAAQIVRDLQRFSRLQEKIKAQEEEIEGWKQSLTLQAQELKKRELELDEEFAQLEQQLQAAGGEGAIAPAADGAAGDHEALALAQAEADRIREEFERKSNELEQAWAHLRGEQQRLVEQQQAVAAESAIPGAAGLDPEQAARLRELVDYLVTTHLPVVELTEQLQLLRETLEGQQANLNHYLQQLEEQRADAQQQQQYIDRQQAALDEQQEQLQHTRMMLEEARDRVHHLTQQRDLKVAEQQWLVQQLSQMSLLQEQLTLLARGEAPPGGDEKSGVDLAALAAMPEAELQRIIDELQQEFERLGQFVADQEEELKLQRDAVAEVEEKIKAASVYDAPALEQELADEQEQRKLLDETLVGQRRTLAEKQAVLSVHLQVLRRRQGIAMTDGAPQIDLTPILDTLAADQAQIHSQQEVFEREIAVLAADLATATSTLQTQLSTCEQQQGQIQFQEAELKESRSAVALLWGRVNLYEEMLEPQKEALDEMQHRLVALEALCQQAKQTGDYQQEAIASLSGVIQELAV